MKQKTKRCLVLLAGLAAWVCCMAQRSDKLWLPEAEDAATQVAFAADGVIDMRAPKGLTLWYTAPMEGDGVIEYEAQVAVEREGDRLSDLNCFWKASDPRAAGRGEGGYGSVWKRRKWRSGVFARCYSMQLYYMSIGGNHNSTTRFRRYTAGEAGITDEAQRPAIRKEYTDKAHLLRPNHWYKVKIACEGNRVRYWLDGELLVDYRDPQALQRGWFGFRTTQSHTRLRNFRYTSTEPAANEVPLRWIGDEAPQTAVPCTWGVPFPKGKVADPAEWGICGVETDAWTLARWPDGSVKWGAYCAITPPQPFCPPSESKIPPLTAARSAKGHSSFGPGSPTGEGETKSQLALIRKGQGKKNATETQEHARVKVCFSSSADNKTPSHETVFDSLMLDGKKITGAARFVASTALTEGNTTTHRSFTSKIDSIRTERSGKVVEVVKVCGHLSPKESLSSSHTNFISPSPAGEGGVGLFTVRVYTYKGSNQVRIVHSFIYDGDQDRDFISSLGLDIEVPMAGELYNRHVCFGDTEGKVWSESVQPLVGRRELQLTMPDGSTPKDAQQQGRRIPGIDQFSERDRALIADWATWDRYRLSQLTDMGYSIRKQATDQCALIGTQAGRRASGFCFVGDTEQGVAAVMHDFWQSCPSSLEVTRATTSTAHLTLWLWSPEAEPMDLRHYDLRPHGLNASYEDVQPGMSTPYGIARTTEFTLCLTDGFHGKQATARLAADLTAAHQLCCTPDYLHRQHAFGIWSLPHRDTPMERRIEDRMDSLLNIYTTAVEQEHWYGFWHYGDVMHTTDPSRGGWLYDVGGYAWDNTELGTNMWLWYSFLRTGRKDLWTMARAMTRHNSEVDVYHLGEMAGLGSRHNVSHWGCGAKEARISQALWNRFMYFLTADERLADLMDEVTDADQRLYTLDPMRLAQPREQFPCTAPARLRIGPDWLSYASNWLSRWERTGELKYKQKIETGMECIAHLRHGIFTGPQALGYYPDSGRITCETDTTLMNTNHLLPLMGGFEFQNELEETLPHAAWHRVWLDHCARYKPLAKTLSKNSFRIPRLAAYAAYHTGDKSLARSAWEDLLHEPFTEFPRLSTNDAARWSLDAIYMQEVCPYE